MSIRRIEQSRLLWPILCFLFLVLAFPALSRGAETVVYSQGFETDNGSFTLDYGSSAGWQYGTPSGTVGPGAAHQGSKCWGTNLSGLMSRPAEGSIVSPAIPLPTITSNQLIRVRFWGYVDIDGMYDRAEFFVSKDGANWQSLAQLYENMNTDPAAPPLWQKYEFTLPADYSGGNLYLRFRTAVQYSNPTFYCGGADSLSGFYIDDIAVTVFDNPAPKKIFSLRAWEDTSSWASCPWVAPWNGKDYVADNDIYSVARYPDGEYTDYYLLSKPLVPMNGAYPVQVQELQSEDSYTDYTALIEVDHPEGVGVAPDDKGNLISFNRASLISPASAISGKGDDVVSLVATADGKGFDAYSEDTVEVNFGTQDVSQGASLVLGVTGFVMGEGAEKPYIGPPAVVVETQDGSGVWTERGRLRPRFQYSIAAFDLSPYLTGSQVQVRLRSISHSVKYHLIDYVALYTGAKPAFTARRVSPLSASFANSDILNVVNAADSYRFEMQEGQKFDLKFPVLDLAPGNVRDFVFVSKGYYIPKSASYLIYTWDGTNWVLRDSYSFPNTLFTKDFDLSLFLPDPDGEYKVRVWQDYQWDSAAIDWVGMSVGGVAAPLMTAWDYQSGSDIYSQVVAQDSSWVTWNTCPRNRVTQYTFQPPTTNRPPSTNPVSVNLGPLTFSWVYSDLDGDAENQYEVQVWTGPNATGTIVWNPPVYSGSDTSLAYGGPTLTAGSQYYVRVRAFDGKDWGQWSEAAFSLESLCGDLNNDGVVDFSDYVIFRSAYGKRLGDSGYIAEADYDQDGVVSLLDYAQWYKCYRAYLGF